MKPSRYNFFFPYEVDDSKVIAYNSYSNALALLDVDKYEAFQQFVKTGAVITDEKFINDLKHGSFLIDDDCNELERLRLRLLEGRFNTSYLTLTIAPTADCNFRCTYCYEKDVIKPEYMTIETEDIIMAFATKFMKSIETLNVYWYGGEPLMHIESVIRLSEKLIDLCNKHDVVYNANMVSNGYLLTSENITQLEKLKLQAIQITLDGDESTHNKRRPFYDGTDTYQTIIDNICNNKEVLPPISLRINIDKSNPEASVAVTKMLDEAGLLDKVHPYLGRIINDADDYAASNDFDICSFSQEELAYYNRFAGNFNKNNPYPRAIRNYCGADSINSFVIDPGGSIYKCWHDIGKDDKCVGHINQADKKNERLYADYMLYDPTMDDVCANCSLLPVCMGGCPIKRMANAESCTTYKYLLDEHMGLIARTIQSKQQLSRESAIL